MDPFMKDFEHLKIDLETIKLATRNFDQTQVIGSGGFGKVYKAEMSHYKGISLVAVKRLNRKFGQGDPEFWKEVLLYSQYYSHKNLISLLGLCINADEKILIYEYASNGSLDDHISSKHLTWSQRIRICLDAARGLSYLHDDNNTHQRVLIHRDIKSANIFLDDEWNAKVSDMVLSKVVPNNHELDTTHVTSLATTLGYVDPVYLRTGRLTKESDVYSFGVVLMEVLCGKLCYQIDTSSRFSTLIPTWIKSCKSWQLNEIVFQDVMPPLHPDSLQTFSKIAFQCLNEYRESRPLMYHVVRELEAALEIHEHRYLKLPNEYEEIKCKSVEDSQEYRFLNTYSGINIQRSLTSSYKSFTLEEIKRATNGFSDQNILGEGAFGKVFRGNISGTTYDGLVAVKRLKECSKQGQHEFQKEIELTSACNHPNIISLIGCCNEGSERIIVYDFMKKGSLYDCLYIHKEQTPRLSVEQRLEICIGVAKGISYLHYGSQNNIIHSDLKTDNILLDADLVPKISDFGLSRTRVAGPSSSDVVTNTTKGTEGYIAPECYEPNYKVSRKADVYAFGVVFLEVLCERPPWERLLMLALPYIWRREFPKIAPEYVTMNISPGCSRVCVYILKDCLDNNPDNRPTINQVVDNLESASKLQKQESQANS